MLIELATLPDITKTPGRWLVVPWIDKKGTWRETRFDRAVVGNFMYWSNPMHRKRGTSRWLKRIIKQNLNEDLF